MRRSVKTILLCFLVFFLSCELFGQTDNLQFENISTLSGLSTSRAKCIFQDSRGYLWVGTVDGGLNHYDGYSFKVFKSIPDDSTSLLHNNIYNITEDSKGNIWVVSNPGISKYDENSNSFVNYVIRNYFSEISNLNYHAAFEIFIDSKDRIWTGTSYHGAILFDQDVEEFKAIPFQLGDSTAALPQVCGDFTEDGNGVIWAAAGSSGLCWYDEKNSVFRPAQMDFEDWNLLTTQDVFRSFADSENNIWLMTTTELYKYIPSLKKLKHLVNYESSVAINQGHEGEIFEDAQKDIWVVHSNIQHPLKFPNLSNEYITIESPAMKPTDILVDSFGIVWICDWDKGLYKYDPEKQIFYQPRQNTDGNYVWQYHTINALCKSANNPDLIYVFSSLTNRTFIKSYNLRNGRVQDFNLELENNSITFMASNKDGTFLLGLWDNGGMMKWNPKTGEVIPYFADETQNPNLANISVTFLNKDKMNNTWVGTTNGLFCLSADEKNLDLVLPDYAVTSLYLDDDIIWISTYGDGLIKYYSSTNQIEVFQYNKFKNSISHNVLWDLYRDKEGFLWVATENGLNRLDLRNNNFRVYNRRNGLTDGRISAVLSGSKDSRWVMAGEIVTNMYKDSLGHICIANYGESNGLLNLNFTEGVPKFKDARGNIYFGSKNGLYYFKPSQRKSSPPIIYFNDIIINGKPLRSADENPAGVMLQDNPKIELNHLQNTLSIEYVALHFAEPEKNLYAYYLEGYDSDWIYTHNREVKYANLNPGSYTFHLRAANRDGVWVKNEKNIQFTIAKPWWNTWYAYISYFVFGIVLLTMIRQYELKRRMELEEKKLLEAENKRKSVELEEARALQLSMLPKELPQLPNLDIAVYMKTATEVGGDYYDFNISLDGTLTVVLGDATGHGLKAGTMVTSVKSLFNSYADENNISEIFNDMTKCIKKMRFEKLFMSFTMLKIKENKLSMSAGGMPPVYIYRASDDSAEEHVFKGMPLGTLNNFPYDVKEISLNKDDVILLTSDGLPELQNENNEQYGYKQLRNRFEEFAKEDPEKVIALLNEDGNSWLNGKEANDDITFVIIKIK